MPASDCFEFWMFRRPKNKKYVSFYFGPFACSRSAITPHSYPLITVTDDKNIVHTASYDANLIYIKFYSTQFLYPVRTLGGGFTSPNMKPSRYKNTYFLFFGPLKHIQNSKQSDMNTWKFYNFGDWFHPLNIKTGRYKKTRVSYFSVL